MSNAELSRLPLLALRDPELVIFPGMLCEVDVGRPFSIKAIELAKENNNRLIVGMQRDFAVEKPTASDFYGICVEAEVKSSVIHPDGKRLRVILCGISRQTLKTVGERDECFYGTVEPIAQAEVRFDDKLRNLCQRAREIIVDQLSFVALKNTAMPSTTVELSKFVDDIASQIEIDGNKKRALLSLDVRSRLKLLIKEMEKLAHNVEVEMESESNSNDSFDSYAPGNEAKEIAKKIESSGMPEEVLKVARSEARRLSMMSPSQSEFQVTYNYLENLVSLPWDKSTEDKIDIEDAERILNEDHYGLEKVKQRILEFLAVRKLKPEHRGSILCFAGPPGVGKAQPLNAKVLTPTGFVDMGDIKIGDRVITPDGQEARVIGVFPQGMKNIYKIKFSDGTHTRSCIEHLWEVQTRDDRKHNKRRVISTEEMMGNLYVEGGQRRNYSIKFVEPAINFNDDISLDPYLVGILLSEGQLDKTSFSNGDNDIIQKIAEIVSEYGCKLTKRGDYYYDIVKVNHNPANNINMSDNRSVVSQFIDNSGLKYSLFNTKFIPNNYKYCSFSNREKLLQGILDGDGFPDRDACAIEWSSSSYRFALDMMELVQSLGGQATYFRGEAFYTYKGETLQGKDRHRLRISLPLEVVPFYCQRKANIYNDSRDKKKNLQRYIEDICFDGREEAQCILIDHPDHLYITDNFIVTHNTSLGKSIARATGREFVRMSLGGVDDEAEIRGHRRTYVGAIPGRIMENIKKVGSKNPVFMLDEVDKLCANVRGDPSSALLEVLDPEQNHAFVDHYLSVPFDLSQVLFIGTVNEISPIAPALRDRMEIIEIPGYSPSDKIKIAQRHLIPKQCSENGLEELDVMFTPRAIARVVEEYTCEAGVRSLERECGTIARKLAVVLASGQTPSKIVKYNSIPKHLGPPKTFAEKAADKPEIGLSTGLAWSKYGGSILFVETSLTPGSGKIERLTGNLGKVIQESVSTAYTWMHSNADVLGIDLDRLRNHDVHIHFPSGAVPKDGPSAGVAVTAALVSVFTNRPVRNDVAMTGEISLRGRVLPIGGLKEKVLAAHRSGIKVIILPEKNKYDLEEVPADVLKEMKFVQISHVSEALDILLLDEIDSGPSDLSPAGSGKALMNKEI